MKKPSHENNFIYLTIALVLLLLVAALIDQFPVGWGQQTVQAASIITVAAGINSVSSSRNWFSTSIGFLIAILVVAGLGLWLEHAELDYLHLLILIGFYLYASYQAARQVLFTGPIDFNKIVGAICIYLLMGLVWGLSYLFIAQVIPGSFNGLEQLPWYDNFADGDISPVAPVARFLVYMEAIFGVFYMAVLVASLIGIKTSKITSDS